MNKNYSLTAIMLFIISAIAQAQTVNIPDTNFKKVVLHLGIDYNYNGEIEDYEAQALTHLDISSESISDLTGLEAFTSLTWFDCSYNNLTHLDVHFLTQLEYLNCSNNQLVNPIFWNMEEVPVESIVINYVCVSEFHNGQWVEVIKADTVKGFFDFETRISGPSMLKSLICSNNHIPALRANDFTQLERLYCEGNQLNELDITNLKLKELKCQNNNPYMVIYVSSLDAAVAGEKTGTYSKDFNSTWLQPNANSSETVRISSPIGIYPNPASESFIVNRDFKSLKIINSLGEEVMTSSDHQVNISHLKSGNYFVHITDQVGKTYIQKLIKID